jgi:hypothetical protein
MNPDLGRNLAIQFNADPDQQPLVVLLTCKQVRRKCACTELYGLYVKLKNSVKQARVKNSNCG